MKVVDKFSLTHLYAYETWAVYQSRAKRQSFPIQLFDNIVKIKWQDKILDRGPSRKDMDESMHEVI